MVREEVEDEREGEWRKESFWAVMVESELM